MWTAVELRELRIFLALAEELHFGRTAERLRISQPGVSEAIRGLEARIGARLFERTSRRVSLTSDGEELRGNLVPALAAVDRELAQASDHAASVAGRLRIGFTSTTDGPPLHRLIDEFRSRHPDCQVIPHEVDTGDPYAAVRRGDVDVLVNWLAVDEPDLTAGPAISLHSRLLVVARSHRLATRWSVLIEDLADEQVVLMPPPFPAALHDAILPPRTPTGRPITRAQPVRSINEIAAHVAHGRIVHVTMTRVPVFTRDDVVLIPIQDLAPTPLGLIWSTARENAKIRALGEIARAIGPCLVQKTDGASVP
jgi:DNA-binding transcriptional LysR family regulator